MTYKDLARTWKFRGNQRMVEAIVNSFRRMELRKRKERQQLGGHGAR